MTLQSTVSINMGAGVVGELANDSPWRAQPFTLVSADAAYNVFGRAFTKTSEGVAQAGSAGSLGFAGFLVNPKGSALYGTQAGGTLAPTLTLPNNSMGELLTMGSIWVTLPQSASIGNLVVYNNTTGALDTIAPGGTVPGGFTATKAFVDRFNVAAAGLALITINPIPA